MILLVSLMLLTLFLLLGTTYILTAGARRPCTISDALAKATRRLAEEVSHDPPLCGGPLLPTVPKPVGQPVEVVDQWHRDSTRALAVNRYLMASLLNDKHGDLYRRGTVNGDPTSPPIVMVANPSGATYPNFYSITVELEEKAATPPAGVKATYEPYEGRILTFVDDNEPNAAFRIVSGKSVGGTNPERWRFLAHPVNHLAHPDISVINTKAGSNDPTLRPSVVILGREFSGDSDGTSDDLHESWDAPDDRNIFLAWVQEEAVLGRDGIPDPATAGTIGKDAPEKPWRYVIPSYHRPDRLLAELQPLKSGTMTAAGINDFLRTLAARWTGDNGTQQEVASRTTLLHLRPMGKMEFHPDEDEQVSSPGVLSGRLSKSWTRAGFPSRPAWQTVDPNPAADGIRANSIYEKPEHPDFTGSNLTIINGQKYYFDPINGPWDVDNDGDGVQDSVWIDVGAPEIVINNQRCRPLVAMMILDLDSRVNVNVHGSLAERDHGITQTNVPAAATGVRYAGLASTAAAPLPAGLGWGPADVNPRAVLARGYPEAGASAANGLVSASLNRLTNLFVGIDSSASERTPRDFLIPTVPAEGRYGDSVNLPNALTPSPGKRGVLDPPIDDPSAPQRLRYPPARFGDASVPLGAPVDPWATTRVGLDQMGQPYFSRHPVGSTPWQQDRVDTPYDLSVGTNAPKPGWAYDPDVTLTGVINYQDNLYTPSQLERLLRLFEPGVETVSPRLLSLLGRDVEKARLTVTTESWDSAAACVPWPVLHPLLTLSDQADRTKPSLLSWDLQMGLRMDVNRPFGDGVDDNGNGVIDEPAEAVLELDADKHGLTGTPFARQALTNGRDVDGNGIVNDADQQLARQLYARHLFVLAMRAGSALPPAKLADYRREAAQWAVNVVDFRDTDSIMTRFQYDATFSADSDEWIIDPNDSPVVWGCERPELLLTETTAWRNIKETGKSTDDSLRYTDIGSGGFVVELYHPWTSLTSQVDTRANPLPAELMTTPANRYRTDDGGAIDVTKRNPAGEPVFQLMVVDDSSTNTKKMLEDASWPNPADLAQKADIKSIVYLGSVGGGAAFDDFNGDRWGLRPGSTTTLRPGQFALVAGPDTNNLLPILSKQGPIEGLRFDPPNRTVTMVRDPDHPEGAPPNSLTEFITIPAPLPLQADPLNPGPLATTQRFELGQSPRVDRVSGGRYPNDSPSTPDDPIRGNVGALVMVQNVAGGTGNLRLPTNLGESEVALPTLVSTFANNSKYRILLRRLANPLENYDADTNPYLTIDSICAQDQGVILDNPDDPIVAPGTLRSINRCASQKLLPDKPIPDKPILNDIWSQDRADISWESPSSCRGAPNCMRRSLRSVDPLAVLPTLEATLGFLPPYLRIPVPDPEQERDNPTDARKVHVLTPPFPWLAWLNRDFVSPHELLLVPKSSPSQLLRDHSAAWPFHHLFFGGGRLVPEGEDAAPTSAEVEPEDRDVWGARVGMFEFLRVHPRFADGEQRVPPLDAVSLSIQAFNDGLSPLFLPPHNYLSHFREPGRVNVNTLSSADVWAAMNGGQPSLAYDDEIRYEANPDPRGYKPVDTFGKSEDWAIAEDDSPSQPVSGNWRIDPDEDDNSNGLLDLNDDSNNDGRQAVSLDPTSMQSLAVSRRGWGLTDPLQDLIAGHFDRLLNRGKVTTDDRWFGRPFQSGWQSIDTARARYVTENSVLLRTTRVNLAGGGGGGEFTYGFKHVNEAGADRYLVSSTGMKRYSEWQNPPVTYWGPSANNAEGRLVYKIDFPATTQSIRLKAEGPAWDFGGGCHGASAIEVSRDGEAWTVLRNSLEPRNWGVGWAVLDEPLPAAAVGGSSLWIRLRFLTEGAPTSSYTVAQFGRSTSASAQNVFSVQAELSGGETVTLPLVTRQLGLPKELPDHVQLGRHYADPRRHPYFLHQDIVRLSNLVTPRSNVFAVWMTVGFFELDDRDRLGAEYGLDNGSAIRHKAFQIIDRSIPVGYEPNGAFKGNSRNTILHYHFTN